MIQSITLVDSLDEAIAFSAWVSEQHTLGIDTETTGLQWWKDELRTVQFGNLYEAWVIPAHRWKGLLHETFDRIEYTPTVFHNWKFDCHFLNE